MAEAVKRAAGRSGRGWLDRAFPFSQIPRSPRGAAAPSPHQSPTQRHFEAPRRHSLELHARDGHMPGELAGRAREPRERGVAIEIAPADSRRGLARGEPGLEVRVPRLEDVRLAVRLQVDAADQLAVVEERQAVIAVLALVARNVDLDPVEVAPQAMDALAVPEERIERAEER